MPPNNRFQRTALRGPPLNRSVRQKKGDCREASAFLATSVMRRLFQWFDACAKVDMKHRSIHHESRYGFDTGGLCFFKARFIVAEMDDLNVVFRRVKCFGYVLLGGNAYGAASVLENGFGFHNCSPRFVSQVR